ncbi:hypothetical protein ACFCV3_02115 [Kribbella sp. NPDC056345]|uniref:hypothetical protein n=1 Tax=Kribbella sp. NPDC056345 TaxID=3345789 RepID=UPI0035D6FD6A
MQDVGTGLVSSLLFGLLTYYVNKWRKPAPVAVDVSRPVRAGTTVTLPAAQPETWDELLERRREIDRFLFGGLLFLSVTVLVPFLIGGVILGVLDATSDGTTNFITDRMRDEGEGGYVQYWLGFSVLAVIEILALLLRPWRGRAFGVGFGIALAVFLIVFGIPASRGVRIW